MQIVRFGKLKCTDVKEKRSVKMYLKLFQILVIYQVGTMAPQWNQRNSKKHKNLGGK